MLPIFTHYINNASMLSIIKICVFKIIILQKLLKNIANLQLLIKKLRQLIILKLVSNLITFLIILYIFFFALNDIETNSKFTLDKSVDLNLLFNFVVIGKFVGGKNTIIFMIQASLNY